MKEMCFRVLIGSLIIFAITTLLADTGFGVRFGQDEDMLFGIQVGSLLASIASAAGLLVTQNPPDVR
ncbi:hypothetical protein RX327_33645 [Bradyrhizobium sp. BEA-2-5]|uniref:hypothetical protein n=1 Tax=Bradyrhizobium sp. BEA-2-5 TaxID=3080015 RepID=UPI00293F2291|nr:hypothetical protein [Bradyrhizobium sp. BEA-2-5]WOH80649.1 hypothetical protein RX327_33645 [Bradyrhizobium sp. BEA-2-5]